MRTRAIRSALVSGLVTAALVLVACELVTVDDLKFLEITDFSGDGDCMLAISVGDSARVDIGVNDTNDDTDKACDAVNKIATIVEAKLPKG